MCILLGRSLVTARVYFLSDIDVSFIQGPSSVTAVAGHSVTLVCNPPVSVPQATVNWYKDNKPFIPRAGEFQVII